MSSKKKRSVQSKEPEGPRLKRAKKAESSKTSKPKASSSKERDIFDRDERIVVRDLDPAMVKAKYVEALHIPDSDVLSMDMITISGKMCGTQWVMDGLIKAHEGKKGSKARFNLLIASTDQYDLESAKVLQAECKRVPIVHELYLYETIIKGRKPNIEKYSLENVDLEALGIE